MEGGIKSGSRKKFPIKKYSNIEVKNFEEKNPVKKVITIYNF